MDETHDPAWRAEVASAFEANRVAIYRVAYAHLYGTGYESEAEDVVSTAISEVLGRGRRPVESWQGYLVRIVQRRALDFLKSAEVRHRDAREVDLDAYALDADPAEQVDAAIDTHALIVQATDALNSLEPAMRDIAAAHIWHGESQVDLAARLGISQPRVSQIIKEARKIIQSRIEGGEQ